MDIKNKSKTYKIVLCAILTALVFAATLINIPIGMGYINLGDSIIFVSCVLFGWLAVPSAVLGSAFADMILAPQYTVGTLIVKAVMAIIVVALRGNKKTWRILLAMLLASLWMQVGYMLFEVILLILAGAKNDIVQVFGVVKLLLSSLQTVVCVPLGLLLYKVLARALSLEPPLDDF